MHELIVKTGGTLYESLFQLHNAKDGLLTMSLLEQVKTHDTDFNLEEYLSKPDPTSTSDPENKFVDPKLKENQIKILR